MLLRVSNTQDRSRIDQMNPPPKQWPIIRVLVFSKEIGLLIPQVDFMVSHMLQRILISSFKPYITNLLSQLLR